MFDSSGLDRLKLKGMLQVNLGEELMTVKILSSLYNPKQSFILRPNFNLKNKRSLITRDMILKR